MVLSTELGTGLVLNKKMNETVGGGRSSGLKESNSSLDNSRARETNLLLNNSLERGKREAIKSWKKLKHLLFHEWQSTKDHGTMDPLMSWEREGQFSSLPALSLCDLEYIIFGLLCCSSAKSMYWMKSGVLR